MKPTQGRIVLYKLSKSDCEQITTGRTPKATGEYMATTGPVPVTLYPKRGNFPQMGDVVPAIVVRVWETETPIGINGQAFLDGNDTLWIASASEGDNPGQWCWPERV